MIGLMTGELVQFHHDVGVGSTEFHIKTRTLHTACNALSCALTHARRLRAPCCLATAGGVSSTCQRGHRGRRARLPAVPGWSI